ncbi:DUF2953 domain-containing protein [Methanothermobacter sp.]|uniref:DUF2953 domain-containing protein n=1 Tax=Methanothermobacter sp. TaxID=1884223 RepID=UPI002616A2DF|nr:DUF2953 domain-containing protein [Methanothermobacter sp.]MDI9618420.1 DUF2953 domain-containing protein [Methanothermobacter sp.]
MKILLIIISFSLAAFLLVLISKYTVILRVVRDGGRTDFRIWVTLWRVRILTRSFNGGSKRGDGEAVEPAAMKRIFRRTWRARRYLMDLLMAMISSITIRRLEIRVSVGTGDASDTAIITGYLWTISALTSSLRNIEINAIPDFLRGDINGKIELEMSIRPLKPVLVFTMLLLRKPLRDLFMGFREL